LRLEFYRVYSRSDRAGLVVMATADIHVNVYI
jgi:hypothetical protein